MRNIAERATINAGSYNTSNILTQKIQKNVSIKNLMLSINVWHFLLHVADMCANCLMHDILLYATK